MSVHDHRYIILPQKKIQETYGKVPESMTWKDVIRDGWWEGEPIPSKEELEAILPSKQSVVDRTDLWGSDREDKIEIGYDENGKVTDLVFQVDLLNEFPFLRNLVQAFSDLATKYQWVLIESEGREEDMMKILMPRYDSIAKNLRLSEAQDFVTDPEVYLKKKRGTN